MSIQSCSISLLVPHMVKQENKVLSTQFYDSIEKSQKIGHTTHHHIIYLSLNYKS